MLSLSMPLRVQRWMRSGGSGSHTGSLSVSLYNTLFIVSCSICTLYVWSTTLMYACWSKSFYVTFSTVLKWISSILTMPCAKSYIRWLLYVHTHKHTCSLGPDLHHSKPDRSMYLAQRSLSSIYAGNPNDFQPSMALDFFPRLLCHLAVRLAWWLMFVLPVFIT